MVSEKNIFLCFYHDSPRAGPVWTPGAQLAGTLGANNPRGGAIFDPRGMVGRIYKEDHYMLLHTKYESSGPCGLGEEDLYGPQGHGWQDL